jgi:hypothetical protein
MVAVVVQVAVVAAAGTQILVVPLQRNDAFKFSQNRSIKISCRSFSAVYALDKK